VRASGATVARSDAFWEAAEPSAPVGNEHRYDWTFDDRVAGALAAQGLTWLPIIDYTAPWDQSVPGQDHSPPRSDADYAAYAAAFAARYDSGGAFWRAHPGLTAVPVSAIEIWNEPDNPEFWTPRPDAAAYAQLYLAARGAIDAVAPGIRVLVGGLTDAVEFLPAMVQAVPALRGHLDGVAVHPYGTPQVVVARVRGARAALVGLGMGEVPLYITEFGWTTQPRGAVAYTPASRRPAEIAGVLATLGHLQCGLAATVLYTWVTPERDPTDPQDWYGIANPADPSAGTPDTAAFAAGLRAAAAPAWSGPGPAPAPCPT
jgi:polysaccharide biosynthesis protein PslG